MCVKDKTQLTCDLINWQILTLGSSLRLWEPIYIFKKLKIKIISRVMIKFLILILIRDGLEVGCNSDRASYSVLLLRILLTTNLFSSWHIILSWVPGQCSAFFLCCVVQEERDQGRIKVREVCWSREALVVLEVMYTTNFYRDSSVYTSGTVTQSSTLDNPQSGKL